MDAVPQETSGFGPQIFFLRLKVACKFLGSSITCEASEKRAVPSLMDLLVFCHSNPEVCPLYQYKEKMSFKKEMHFAEELSAGFLGERYLSEKDHHQTRSDRSHFSRLEKEEKARLSDVLKSRVPTNLANSRCVDTRDK
jgi:hypothetical protein